jgi:cytosine/adenosine deaminase-related metal-dependent hydrolase
VIQRLDDFGLLAPTTALGHCVHVNEKEMELIKRSGAGVAHVPVSDMFHGSGVAPVRRMVNLGIPAGIGGDGLSLDGFQDIRAAYLLQKVMDKTPDALPSSVALKMATSWGAKLYGLGNELGSIEPGKLGDLVILKPSFPMITPDNVMWHLVNSAKREDIETVLVGGRAVMRNGEIQTLSERIVKKAAERSARKIERKLRE